MISIKNHLLKSFLLLIIYLCPLILSARGSKYYIKKSSCADTILSSQRLYSQWWKKHYQGLKFDTWISSDKSFKFSPDKPIELNIKSGKGKNIWVKHPEYIDGQVHYDLIEKGPKNVSLYRKIHSDKEREITAYFGAFSELAIWLNGKQLLENKKIGNKKYPESDTIKLNLNLKKGVNHLILKFPAKHWGGFYFSIIPQGQLNPDPVINILKQVERDFPVANKYMHIDSSRQEIISWLRDPDDHKFLTTLLNQSLKRMKEIDPTLHGLLSKNRSGNDPKVLLESFERISRFRQAYTDLKRINIKALKLAVDNLATSFPKKYTHGRNFLKKIIEYEKLLPSLERSLKKGDKKSIKKIEEISTFKKKVLLANPLLDFENLLVIKRKPHVDPRRSEAHRGLGEYLGTPRQSSFQNHRISYPYGWENEISALNLKNPDKELSTIHKPKIPQLTSDTEMHYDGEKFMFSTLNEKGYWQIYELNLKNKKIKQLSPKDQPDIHNFDSCYLPNGKIVFISTAPFQGVPCNASIVVGMSFLMDGDGKNIRQLCFEQDHNYYPSVMNDGRILYLRWEYTDIPHVWGRYLFTMNPDGSGQREYYGSGEYWPNSTFFARAIPNHPTKVVGIVTGHHIGREGELIIFDPSLGRNSTKGVVQRIPERGKKVEPLIEDKLTEFSWPKFIHPYPLNENYFFVSCKPTPDDLWGIYLVDTFDNMLLIKELEDYAIFEPVPIRKTKRQPIIHERIDLSRKDALMYIQDIYTGPGLKGLPRGIVKKLRLFTYHFGYQGIAGITHRIGTDGPWEPKQVLGTVNVEPDGSSLFRVPANTPISMQPLDEKNNALQLMRSWATAMPGEFVSCIGCHNNQNEGVPGTPSTAQKKPPQEITPFLESVRGFSFMRDMQPVLDKYCISCHNGLPTEKGIDIPDLRKDQGKLIAWQKGTTKAQVVTDTDPNRLFSRYHGIFNPSYIELRKFIRVGGLESDIRLLYPGEFYANTTELIQILEKGHHNVELDKDSWDRLYTWIDLNAPCHGTWQETAGSKKVENDRKRRIELQTLYAGINKDSEIIPELPKVKIEPVIPVKKPKRTITPVECQNWPFDSAEAKKQQQKVKRGNLNVIDLGNDVKMEMVLIPAGEFVMGDAKGDDDELPLTRVKVRKSFRMSKFEIRNKEYARFDPSHDSRFEHKGSWWFSVEEQRWPMNNPDQPVVRVSWNDAMGFCKWLSEKIGKKASLPTEAQWEYGCRAGTDTAFYYGDRNADFSSYANMADKTMINLSKETRKPLTPDLIPRDDRFNDHSLVTVEVGKYKPNAWGLHDMHGNVREWTRSIYEEYPYKEDDGRNELNGNNEQRVVRGGSWYDRPKRCRSSFRLSYPQWQKIYNVGFRIIIEY